MFPIPIWESFESNKIDVQYLTSQHNPELIQQEEHEEEQEAESQEADGEAEAEAPAVEEDQENGGNLWH